MELALFDSSSSRFLLDDTGAVQRDLSPYLTDIDGLPGARTLRETTSMSDTGRTFLPDAEDARVELRGLFDDTATTGPDAVLGPLRTHGSAVDFEYAPEGTAVGSVKYSGICWVEDYELRARVGSLVEWAGLLQVEGVVSRGTY